LSQKKDWPKWELGEPDLVIELPPFTTPATGTIPHQNIKLDNPLDHDVWVRAVDFLPGQRAVLITSSPRRAARLAATSA
jgi:hypothetical protein